MIIDVGIGPAGSDTQVQYNKGGFFAGDPEFTFDDSTDILSVAPSGTGQLLIGPTLTWTDPNVQTGPDAAFVAQHDITSINDTIRMGHFVGVQIHPTADQVDGDNWASFAELEYHGTHDSSAENIAFFADFQHFGSGDLSGGNNYGATLEAYNAGTGTISGELIGGGMLVGNFGTGLVASAVAGYFALQYGADITTATAIQIESDTALKSGGTITNSYGLSIGDVTGGSTLNIALQTGAGLVSFGDDVRLADGKAIKTDTTTAHTAVLQAYDVDNTTYRTFATLTNGNTPSLIITPPSGGTVTVNATTLQQGGNAISLASSFTTSGANALTLTTTGSTNITLPTSGTLLTTAGSGASLTFPGTLSIASGKTLTASNTLTFTGTDSSSVAFGTGGTVTYTSNKLSVFAATSSSELAGVISDETGSGALVFGTSPTFTTDLTTPLAKLSASSDQLVFQSGGTTGTLSWTPVTANKTVTFPNATGGVPIVIKGTGVATGTTNSATEANLATVTIPADVIGANGSVMITALWRFTGTAGTKTPIIRHNTTSGATSSGTVIAGNTAMAANSLSAQWEALWIHNANATNAQVVEAASNTGQFSGSTVNDRVTGAIDTTAASYLNFNASTANSGDTVQLLAYVVTIYPGA